MVGRSSINSTNSQANQITYYKGIYCILLHIWTCHVLAGYYCAFANICEYVISIRLGYRAPDYHCSGYLVLAIVVLAIIVLAVCQSASENCDWLWALKVASTKNFHYVAAWAFVESSP